MQTQEDKLYLNALFEYQAAFPGIQPPAPTWFVKWLIEYDSKALSDTIQTLQRHPKKPLFTTESTGRAISALLRDGAIRAAAQKLVRP
jgi:hypothetical protein